MSNSPFQLAGSRPTATSYSLLGYRQRLLAEAYAPLQESAKARATTYYVDSSAGDDSNDGLSTGAPVQTLSEVHDLIQASSGDVRVRFKYGSEFVGSGKDYNWLSSHNCAVYANKDNLTFDCYGDPDDGVVVFRISGGLGSSWTDSGDGVTYYASGWTDAVDMVYETDGSTDEFSRETSLVDCQATSRSMYYSVSTDRVYVNYNGADAPPSDLYAVEANNITCLRLEGDDIIVDLDGAEFYGYGLDNADQNSHDYAVGVLVQSGDVVTVANLEAYYGSSHTVATWHESTGTDGHVSWLNLKGGRGYAGRLINAYQPSGGMTTIVANCSVVENIRVVNGHTASGTLGEIWVDSCQGRFGISDTVEEDTIYFGCTQGTGAEPLSSLSLTTGSTFINCEFYYRGSGDAFTSGTSSAFLNCIIDFDSTYSSDNFIAKAIFSGAVSAGSVAATFDHCLLRFSNPSGGSKRGVGLCYDSMQNSDADTNAIATRSIWARNGANSSTYPVAPGIGDSDTNQVDCSYHDIRLTTSRNQAGYSNVTTAQELARDPADEYQGQRLYRPTTGMVRSQAPTIGYDILGQRRRSDVSTDGPMELIPSSESNSSSAGNGLVTSLVSELVG